MKKTILFNGICAAVAMLFGANADAKVIGSIIVERGPQGVPGTGIQYQDAVANCTALNAIDTTNLVKGDAYFNRDDSLLYIYDGTNFPACGSGVPFQGPQGEQGAQGCSITAETAETTVEGRAAVTTTLKNTCTNQVIDTFTVSAGADACVPNFTTSHSDETHKTTAQYTCGSTNQTFEIPDGLGVCDGVANPATAVKTYTKTYTAPTATAAGYVTLHQTMCNNSNNSTDYPDTCIPVVSANKDICSGNGGQQMECTRSDTGAMYNICRAITTENASTITAAIAVAQSAADTAQQTAESRVPQATFESYQATVTANLANKADKDKVLSNEVTFATETVNGVESYVLKDGNSTVAVLAAKQDLKGDPGVTPCRSITVVKNENASTEEAAQYDVICEE